LARSLLWLVVLVVLAISGVYVVQAYGIVPPTFWKESLLFLTASFGLMFLYLFRASAAVFIYLFLASMVVKLLAFAAYCVWMILEDKQNAGSNVVFFLIMYVVLTSWEVIALFRKSTR